MADVLEYKCPCCDGAISFDSGTQKMKCPFCGSEFDVESLKEYDAVLNEEKNAESEINWETTPGSEWDESEKNGLRSYICKTCGGEIIGDENTAASACPYCGNPVVMSEHLSGNLKPDYVIPFKLDKEAAKKAFISHLKGKKLLPKVFKSENHIDEIKGIYVPFWLFDANSDGQVRYKGTRTSVWSDSRFIYTKTNFYSLIRGGKMSFEHVPVDGSSKMADDLMESIEPFDFSQAVDFQTAYLSGYFADKYDVDAEHSTDRANRRIIESTEEALRDMVHGYESVIRESGNVSVKNGIAKYALYPVWILNTTWKDNKYVFAMNGQTGKFVGDLPVDKGAYWRWFFMVFGIAAVVAFALLWFII